MKTPLRLPFALLAVAVAAVAEAQTPITPVELAGPECSISGGNISFTVRASVVGRRYQLQGSDSMSSGSWQNIGAERIGDGTPLVISTPYDQAVRQRYYWLVLDASSPAPTGFSMIPAGSFQMGDQSSPLLGEPNERPVHSVSVSPFYMGQTLVTKAQWDEVRAWGASRSYTDLPTGSGKAPNHPVQTVEWYAMVKWCNARSEQENLTPCYTVAGAVYRTGNNVPTCNWVANGYRLPTEAEWEKAARGGLVAQNFPWGNTISHSQANYRSDSSYSYDISPTRGYHPSYAVGSQPYTSSVGSFAANGYGLYDMSGNIYQWCWDLYGGYSSASQNDPKGPASGLYRVYRGGMWIGTADRCRTASRHGNINPLIPEEGLGFRLARSRL